MVMEQIEFICQEYGSGRVAVSEHDALDHYYTKPSKMASALNEAAVQQMGANPIYRHAPFSSDGRFIHTHYPDAEVLEFGPRQRGTESQGIDRGGMHQVDESLEIEDLQKLQKTYRHCLMALNKKI